MGALQCITMHYNAVQCSTMPYNANASLLHSWNSRSDPACRLDNWSCDHLIIPTPHRVWQTFKWNEDINNNNLLSTYYNLMGHRPKADCLARSLTLLYHNLTQSVTLSESCHGSLDFIGIMISGRATVTKR